MAEEKSKYFWEYYEQYIKSGYEGERKAIEKISEKYRDYDFNYGNVFGVEGSKKNEFTGIREQTYEFGLPYFLFELIDDYESCNRNKHDWLVSRERTPLEKVETAIDELSHVRNLAIDVLEHAKKCERYLREPQRGLWNTLLGSYKKKKERYEKKKISLKNKFNLWLDAFEKAKTKYEYGLTYYPELNHWIDSGFQPSLGFYIEMRDVYGKGIETDENKIWLIVENNRDVRYEKTSQLDKQIKESEQVSLRIEQQKKQEQQKEREELHWKEMERIAREDASDAHYYREKSREYMNKNDPYHSY